MRISDWSSDVCSSDLRLAPHRRALRPAGAGDAVAGGRTQPRGPAQHGVRPRGGAGVDRHDRRGGGAPPFCAASGGPRRFPAPRLAPAPVDSCHLAPGGAERDLERPRFPAVDDSIFGRAPPGVRPRGGAGVDRHDRRGGGAPQLGAAAGGTRRFPAPRRASGRSEAGLRGCGGTSGERARARFPAGTGCGLRRAGAMTLTVETIGAEAQPLCILDDFAPRPDALRAAAAEADFESARHHYPGVRAALPGFYLESQLSIIAAAARLVFGVVGEVRLIDASFSIVATPAAALSVVQRVPHCDAFTAERIALIHYLSPATISQERCVGNESVSPC